MQFILVGHFLQLQPPKPQRYQVGHRNAGKHSSKDLSVQLSKSLAVPSLLCEGDALQVQ